MRPAILFILIWPLLQSCQECGPQKELTIELYISGKSNRLNKITAIGALNEDAFKNFADNELKDSWNLQLPISLNSDTTTYIFAFEDRTDTLSIFHERSFYFEDGCGFVADVKSAKGKSTFSYLNVYATSYIGQGKALNPYSGGISIRAQL